MFDFIFEINHSMLVAILSWFAAQCLKVIIVFLFKKKVDFRRLIGAGGMPSSHSAVVVSLAASLAKHNGLSSPEFAIAGVLCMVVMYDASNIRRSAGEQAKILNYMMDHWAETTPEIFSKDLKELLGHTPVEVFAGAILGLLFGIMF